MAKHNNHGSDNPTRPQEKIVEYYATAEKSIFLVTLFRTAAQW